MLHKIHSATVSATTLEKLDNDHVAHKDDIYATTNDRPTNAITLTTPGTAILTHKDPTDDVSPFLNVSGMYGLVGSKRTSIFQ